MAAPTLTVEIAFSTSNPLTVPGSWTDVTTYVRGISTRRGRNHELGRTGAGEATVVFDNGDRRFDPTYSSGAYYPNVLPMKRLRIRATHNAVTYDLFHGYVEDWGQEWTGRPINGQGDAQAVVRCVDAFKFLNLIDVATYPAEVINDGPECYFLHDGGEADNLEAVNFGIAEDAPTIRKYPLNCIFSGTSPLDGGTVALTQYGYYAGAVTGDGSGYPIAFRKRFRNDWTVEAWVLPDTTNSMYVAYIGSGASATAYVQVTNTNKVRVTMGSGGSPLIQTGANAMSAAWHHLAVVRTGTVVDIYVDGAYSESLTGWKGSYDDDFGIESQFQTHVFKGTPGSAALSHVAAYSYPLPAARIAVHAARTLGYVAAGQTVDTALTGILDAINWASGDRSITVSTKTTGRYLPEGNALEALLDLAESTDGGLGYIRGDGKFRFLSSDVIGAAPASLATWGDAGGELNYDDLSFRYDDTDLYTQVRATASELPSSLATDSTAATTYGPRTLDSDAGHLGTINQVDDRASGLLSRYKAPAFRPETLHAGNSGSDVSRMAEMLTSDPGRRVTVVRRPPGGGSSVSVPCFVEGVSHDVSGVLTQWGTTLNLAPVLDAIPWILADATYGVLGTTTDLGY